MADKPKPYRPPSARKVIEELQWLQNHEPDITDPDGMGDPISFWSGLVFGLGWSFNRGSESPRSAMLRVLGHDRPSEPS